MEVRYTDRKIEKICTNEREMKRKLSQSVAKRLRLRIAELYNAESFDDLLQGTGRWETLSGDRVGQWSARLTLTGDSSSPMKVALLSSPASSRSSTTTRPPST